MRVRIYRNLSPQYRNQRAWSVMAWDGPRKGKVIDIVDGVVVKDAAFIVSEAGRQRVIREKSKNVHAFVQGVFVESFPLNTLDPQSVGVDLLPRSRATVRIGYDPYKLRKMIREDCLEEVDLASVVVVAPRGVYAHLPACVAASSSGLGGVRKPQSSVHFDVDGWNG